MPPTTRLLIVDDSELDREIILKALSEDADRQYDITIARSFKDGLSTITSTEESWDVILLDEDLGDGQGSSLAKLVRASGLKTPIVMFTGGSLDGASNRLERFYRSGLINHWISKDSSLENLEVVRQTLHEVLTATHHDTESLTSMARGLIKRLAGKVSPDNPSKQPTWEVTDSLNRKLAMMGYIAHHD